MPTLQEIANDINGLNVEQRAQWNLTTDTQIYMTDTTGLSRAEGTEVADVVSDVEALDTSDFEELQGLMTSVAKISDRPC